MGASVTLKRLEFYKTEIDTSHSLIDKSGIKKFNFCYGIILLRYNFRQYHSRIKSYRQFRLYVIIYENSRRPPLDTKNFTYKKDGL